MKRIITTIAVIAISLIAFAQNNNTNMNITKEWDKTFPKSEKVSHEKVSFKNRFGITLVADMYKPVASEGKLRAIAVSGPFGAVKEQASGLYAQTLAEQGFLTIAFDPSFTGESGGEPRYSSSMDINTEDFCAAVDYLSCRKDVDAEHIGILGICGWGGIAINAAALDPRIKATASVTLYNLTRVTQKGYFDSMDEEARHALKMQLAAKRTEEFRSGKILPQGGLPEKAPDNAPDFVKTIRGSLQESETRLSSAFAQFKYGLEHNHAAHASECFALGLRLGSAHSRDNCTRRESPQPILRRRSL